MKRIFFAFMVVLALSFTPVAWAAPGDAPDNPIIVRTAAELDNVRVSMDKYFRLGNDIDLTSYLAPGGAGYDKWGAAGWEPIGDDDFTIDPTPFTGGFEGDGKKITGLWINQVQSADNSAYSIGLFGAIHNATISNLGVEIGTAGVKGGIVIGGLVGYQLESSIINCYATGDVTVVTDEYFSTIGGLVGMSDYSSTINCYATVNITVVTEGFYLTIGGLVGNNYNSRISYSYATGNINGGSIYSHIGGLVGQHDSDYEDNISIITNCYATGNVIGDEITIMGGVGGLVGLQFSMDGSINIIEKSYATGEVRSNRSVGGLVGAQTCWVGLEFNDVVTSSTITNCYATGNVYGNEDIGGLVGYQSQGGSTVSLKGHCSITNSYATGNASGDDYAGGLMGYQYDGIIENRYATGNIAVNGDFGGGLIGDAYGDIINSYRYESATLNGTVIPAVSNDISGIHGGVKTAEEFMTKATYTGNTWLFNDSTPTAGPWNWDNRGFPKLNVGTEDFPFPWGITEPEIPVTGLTVTPGTVTIEVGRTRTLTYEIMPANATDKSVTWSSSNASVATVDASGAVTALSAGTTTITATSNSNPTVMDTCIVTVTDPFGCNAMGYGYLLFALFGAAPFVIRKRK